MKKIVILLLVITLSAYAAFAQGLTLSGEAKTGIFWKQVEDNTNPTETKVSIHSENDDAGNNEGRFRLNMDYLNADSNLGFKLRIQWQSWTGTWVEDAGEMRAVPDSWPYAFGYGNFFDDQITLAIGKLGSSPWGTGGPEMWKELEVGRFGGARIEFKPKLPDGYGSVNFGFVLNWLDSYNDAGMTRDPTLLDVLQESVIGAAYTHDYFMVRFAYRLDSEMDARLRSVGVGEKEGDDIVYRVEERIIQKYLPGFQIWALGFIQGVGASSDDFVEYKNWLFVQYKPETFTAQIRFGYEGSNSRDIIFVKPNFYYRFFGGLIEAGALFGIAQDFGNKIYPDSPFSYIEVVPKIQINFAPGAYTAFEYYYKLEYAYKDDPPYKQTQWMNLRFGIYF